MNTDTLTGIRQLEEQNLTSRSGRILAEFCRCYAAGTPQNSAADLAKQFGHREAAKILQKAATSATTVSELPELRAVTNRWVGSLKNSAFDVMTPFMVGVPRRSSLGLLTAVGSEETEGQAKALRHLQITFGEFSERRANATFAFSKEALMAPDFDPVTLEAEMRSALALATDTPFLTTLRSGISGIPTSGSFDGDMRALFAAVPRGAMSRSVFIGAANVRDDLSLVDDVQARPGRLPVAGGNASLLDVPFVASDALNAGELMLADASRIAYWADDMQIEIARHASLQFDDDPTQSSTSPPGVTPSNTVSLFQTGSVAFSAERRFAAQKTTDTCVALLTGIGQGSPATTW